MSAHIKTSIQVLPDDVDVLKSIIEQKDQRIAVHEKEIIQKNQRIAQHEQRIELLEEYIRLQKLKKYGASSEKSPDQQEMFNEAELAVAVEEVLADNERINEKEENAKIALVANPEKKPGRKPLPANLPRIRIEHDVAESEKICACGCQRVVIGEEHSEQLDIIPAKIQVLVHVRKKYACKQCEDGVLTAPLSPQPIPKSNASPGLLAHIAVSKFQDALPLYRQEAMLQRSGIDLPRNTLASWMIKSGELIQPLLNLLEEELFSYPVLHCDETTVQVLHEPDKPPTSQSYMWVRVGGPPTTPIRLFHYADSRSSKVARTLLKDYRGYLQTDDYAGYNSACANDRITHLGCWAHARRKFVEAQKAASKAKNTKTGKADLVISLIAKLYAIEKEIKDLDPERKYTIRQQQSVPQLQVIRTWLDKTAHKALPKGLLGKALSYLGKNWDKLIVYTQDGRLSIDNNPAENAIRPFVIGRKNWLFSNSVKGAQASANLSSLIETAKANGHEPYHYLRYVFKELPRATKLEHIEALLPWNVHHEYLKEIS